MGDLKKPTRRKARRRLSRIEQAFGRAKKHRCVDCGRAAAYWSLNAEEVPPAYLWAEARCRACHRELYRWGRLRRQIMSRVLASVDNQETSSPTHALEDPADREAEADDDDDLVLLIVDVGTADQVSAETIKRYIACEAAALMPTEPDSEPEAPQEPPTA